MVGHLDGPECSETVSKHKMKRKYRKFESTKTIPENPIVACGPFYEVDFSDCTENGFLADVFTQSAALPAGGECPLSGTPVSQLTVVIENHVGKTSQMDDFDIRPFIAKIFCNKSPMAVVRLIFAAEQAASINLLPINILNVTLGHQIKKLVLVNIPGTAILLVLIQDILRRGQFGY